MSGARGYIYVLSNPSIPNQVKIGKTTRDPTDRVSELSSATGVPTPFVLEFAGATDDCDTAEQVIHNALAAEGKRISSRREFFALNVSDAIDFVRAFIADDESSFSSDDLILRGQQYEYGTAEILQDNKKAAVYYKLAASHGNLEGAYRAARVLQDTAPGESLSFAVLAANGGVAAGHALAGAVLREAGQVEDAESQYALFFDKLSDMADLTGDDLLQIFIFLIWSSEAIPGYAIPALTRHRNIVLNDFLKLAGNIDNLKSRWQDIWLKIATSDELQAYRDGLVRQTWAARLNNTTWLSFLFFLTVVATLGMCISDHPVVFFLIGSVFGVTALHFVGKNTAALAAIAQARPEPVLLQ